MKVTLHAAVSLDGFIATSDGNSDWVSPTDELLFIRRCRSAGCLVLGRKTFDQYRGKLYPVHDADNVVLSRTPQPDGQKTFYVKSPELAVSKASFLGHTELILSGGGQTNFSFLEADLITDIYLSVHTIALGNGIGVFGGASFADAFLLMNAKDIGDGIAQLHYKRMGV